MLVEDALSQCSPSLLFAALAAAEAESAAAHTLLLPTRGMVDVFQAFKPVVVEVISCPASYNSEFSFLSTFRSSAHPSTPTPKFSPLPGGRGRVPPVDIALPRAMKLSTSAFTCFPSSFLILFPSANICRNELSGMGSNSWRMPKRIWAGKGEVARAILSRVRVHAVASIFS